MRTLTATLAAASVLTVAFAGDSSPATRKELAPRTVRFSKPQLPLEQALTELTAQSGNSVADQRRVKTNPTVAVPAEPTTFWPALDAIAQAAGIGFSPYIADGGVAMIDSAHRRVPTAHIGLFRVAVRRIAVSRDEETQTHHCQLAVEVAWEPRFRPFYVELRQMKLTFAPDANQKQLQTKVRAGGAVSVAGRSAIELDVLSPAPERSSPRLATFDGMIWAVGPTRMLAFRFDKLAIGAKQSLPPATQEDVKVAVTSIRRVSEALLVTVEIENPKETPAFDSHQSWVDNNRLLLFRGTDNKKQVFTAITSNVAAQATRARITYAFAESAELPLPKTLDGWTLQYETPARIVELTVPFTLKDLPLP
jgi:hypothetical protein